MPMRPAARPLVTLAMRKCHQFLEKISMMMVFEVSPDNGVRSTPTYKQLEEGKQPHVESDTELVGGEGRPKLRNSLGNVVHGVPQPYVVCVEGKLAFGIVHGSKHLDEACYLSSQVPVSRVRTDRRCRQWNQATRWYTPST